MDAKECGSEAQAVFFDMVHSNNAARCRLWIRHKGLTDKVAIKMITYADLKSDEFLKVNPCAKVPALITDKGKPVFESQVIMQYLEDKYGHLGPPLVMSDPDDRAHVNLLCRVHDIYISSPNCTQPGFSHTQGSMYLPPRPTELYSIDRCMDRKTRSAKLAEIWKQLSWLEAEIRTPYMAGDRLTHADLTWFPTTIFMEFLLPRNFKWPQVFHETEHFPKLTAWFAKCMESDIFTTVRTEIWSFWEAKEKTGEFEAIRGETEDATFKWVYP